MEVLCKG